MVSNEYDELVAHHLYFLRTISECKHDDNNNNNNDNNNDSNPNYHITKTFSKDKNN